MAGNDLDCERTFVIFSFARLGIKPCLAFMNGGHYVVAFGEANLHNNLRQTLAIAKTFPCRFNGEITRRAYIFFCLCVIMQPTFLCSCVLIWQQKITKHYVTHIALVLFGMYFFPAWV